MGRAGSVALLAIVLGACRTATVGQAPESIAPTPVFGPVIGSEVITGRADGEDTWLLAGGIDLVRLDVARRQVARVRLGLAIGESCWGLARLRSGAMWTLKGRTTLARLDRDGTIAEQVALRSPHFGIFAAGDRLVYQEAVFTAPSPALTVSDRDGNGRVAWSDVMTRRFDRLARASAAALNMLSCGATVAAERACWFPDEAVVFLIDPDGHTRRVPLGGLRVVPPEELLTSDTPARPVRDAYVFNEGELWVLSSGTAPEGQAEIPGGWVLARYGPRGSVEGQARLRDAARLILQVDEKRVTLLLSSGYVAEVQKW